MQAKVFIGKGESDLQKKLDKFFEINPDITIQHILQTSSADYHTYHTTISIFYEVKIY